MYWSAVTAAEVPEGVMTSTSTVPALPAGAWARRAESEITVKDGEALLPKVTWEAPSRWLPLTRTQLPPPRGPAVRPRLETVAVEAAV